MAGKRTVDGVVLLDKPTGLTSNAALQKVKRLYQAQKAGHTGSLDPLASGLLPICLGEATKISGYLLNADKSYRFVCQLGITTTTGDAEGDVKTVRPVSYDPTQLESVLSRFRGDIAQIPPMYSALKHQGQRLYALARQGLDVERQPRCVTIHELVLLEQQADRLTLSVRCSKGTYVRSLAEDIGEALGCGAHIVELRRTRVAPYDDTRMLTLTTLEATAQQGLAALDALLLPVDTALHDWPALHVRGDTAYYLRTGQAVLVPQAPTTGWVRLYGDSDRFMGLGEILDDGRVAPRRLLRQA